MRLIATMMMLAALAAGSAAQAQTPADTVAAFRQALGAGDGAAAAELLADDATVLEQGHFETRAQYIAGHLPADLAFAQATTHQVIRQEAGETGDLAYVVSEGRTRGTYKDKAIDSTSTETMVLRRQGESWKIVHIHWSSRPTPAPKG